MSFSCCFKCLTCFGCRDCIVNKFAFMPPTQPSYLLDIMPDKYSDEECGFSRKLLLLDAKGGLRNIPEIEGLAYCAYLIRTSENHYIPCIYVEYTKTKSDWIIIFSHGNSTDIGRMFESYMDLAYNLKCNVFGYEYPGYGKATGKPNEFSIISAAISAYKFVHSKLKFSWSKIIKYGQSVGSGPTIYLASVKIFPLAGVVIHSGIASGLKDSKTYKYDFFPNSDMIKAVNCPVIIFHGESDTEVTLDNAQLLLKNAKNGTGIFYPKTGHNDVEKKNRKDFFLRLRVFLSKLKHDEENIERSRLLQRNEASDWPEDFNHIYIQYLPHGIRKGTSNVVEEKKEHTSNASKNSSSQSRYREIEISNDYSTSKANNGSSNDKLKDFNMKGSLNLK